MRREFGRAMLIGWISVAAVFIGLGLAEAASGDADGTYTVTVTKVELSKDGGTTYTTVFSGSQAINIASASAGAVAASLASGVALEVGTYTACRVTLDSALVVKGYVTVGGTTFYTDGTTFSGVAGSSPGAGYATSTFTIDATNRTQTYTSLSMVVQPGGSPKVTVTFNTAGVVIAGPSIGPPSVGFSTS